VLLAFMMGLQLHNRYASLDPVELTRAVWESPTAFVLILFMVVLLAGMVRFAHDAKGVPKVVLGLVHAGLQLSSVGGVMIAASWLTSELVGSRGTTSMVLFLALVAVLGGIGGTFGMSGYFWATNCFGFHGNEAYAPLHHMDQKHFLRLHFDADGDLTLYPIGIDRVGRKWTLSPDAAPDAHGDDGGGEFQLGGRHRPRWLARGVEGAQLRSQGLGHGALVGGERRPRDQQQGGEDETRSEHGLGPPWARR